MLKPEGWDTMTPAQRDAARNWTGLTPQLKGLEGWRVEVVDTWEGATPRRFQVGRSTGWRPCHIELSRRSAHGGVAAASEYKSVRKLYRVQV